MIKKIVTIGGGNGSFSLLRGLKNFDWEIGAIVAMTDDGGSTGRLRKELGVLPPGDVRYCLSALSTLPEEWQKIWNYRFEEGTLKGHTTGNILLAGLEKMNGCFLEAVRKAEQLLMVKGKVIPATLDNVELCVELVNGKIIKGQHKVNSYEKLQKECRKLFIEPKAKANAKAVSVIKDADIVIIGPGNLYCSILPTLIMDEIREAIIKTKAIVVFNCNLINRKDQTVGYTLDEYVKIINDYLGMERIDVATINTSHVPEAIMKKWGMCEEDLVKYNSKENGNRNYKVMGFPLLDSEESTFSKADEISYLRSPLRHSGEKVGKAILSIYEALNNKK